MEKMDKKIILASNSPRRRELLAGLDLDFEVKVIKGIDESYPETLAPEKVAQYIAAKKATDGKQMAFTRYPYDDYFNTMINKGKEKWEIYAEVAREIYCKIGGFNKSERTLRDSTRYSNSMDSGKYIEANEE